MVRVLVVGGVLIAVASVMHAALGLDKVYGVIRPKTQVGWIAPLLNSNHAGGYVNIALMLMASAVISKAPVIPRMLAIVGSVALVAFELWNASRGAAGTMVLGLLALVILHRRHGRVAPAHGAVLPALLILGGVGMLVLGAFESSARGIADTSLTKLKIVGRAITTMVPAYPFFGVGRGAFESSFPEFMNARNEGFVVFTHPENLVAQWLCEWGVVVTLVAVGVLAVALRSRNALARGAIAIGAWVALVVVALQNLVDFSSETPGVMLALVVCAAIVTSGSGHRRNADRADSFATHPNAVAVVSAMAVGLACAWVCIERAEVLVDAKPHVRDALFDARSSREERTMLERNSMLAHPAEPYFPLLGALRAVADKQDVLPWIERTLERAPIYAPAHLVFARWLRSRSPSHARVEYRIATEELMGPPASELLPLVGSFDDALEAVPIDATAADTLDGLASLLEKTHPATRALIDAEIERRTPGRLSVTARAANDAYDDAVAPDVSPWCNGDSCARDALARAADLERRAPQSSIGYALTMKLLALRGDVRGALAHMHDACTLLRDRSACLVEVATLATTSGSAEATEDIDALAREGCPWSESCAQNLLSAVALEQQRHNKNRALVFLRRAAAIDPDRADLQESVAVQAAAAGLHGEAATAYERLSHLHPTDPRYSKLAEGERLLSRSSN